MPRAGRRPAEKYAGVAVKRAERSGDAGTFGVGGLLIGNDGIIYKTIGNRVIRNNSVSDSTAHVEKQLVDWYFSNKNLPPANNMTIITSLDPCAMCAGAILTGGFNTIHVSQDSQAGISCRGPDFPTLPEGLSQKAREAFSAFGLLHKRPFSGPPSSIFSHDMVDSSLDRRSVRAFSSSLKRVKKLVHDHHSLTPDKLTNPSMLADKPSRIARLLKKYNPRVFSKEYTVNFDKPGINLGHILIQKAIESYQASGVFNSACLVDPFGNVIISESGAEDVSPIRTPFVKLVRRYHKLLLDAGPEGRKYFAHIKYCKTVLLLGLGKDSRSIMEAGCFGASIEGELPKHGEQLQYVIPRQDPDDLQDMLSSLPPLYSDIVRIGDAICEVRDAKLQKFCKSKMHEVSGG